MSFKIVHTTLDVALILSVLFVAIWSCRLGRSKVDHYICSNNIYSALVAKEIY